MLIGQMSYNRISKEADYLQLDICGLTPKDALNKYEKYETNLPVILHGDWTKKGNSENSILEINRQQEYIETINVLNKVTKVIGLTIHPPYKSKISLSDFISIVNRISEETNTELFIENRSNLNILVSSPSEIISLSKIQNMTIDIPQLYISCNYDYNYLINVLQELNYDRIKEIHFANIMRKDNRSYVGRKLTDGVLNIEEILKVIYKVPYFTLEILGGIPTFEKEKNLLLSLIKD